MALALDRSDCLRVNKVHEILLKAIYSDLSPMTYSINWPITVRSAVPFRSGNYYGPAGSIHFDSSRLDEYQTSAALLPVTRVREKVC